MIRRPPRSTRTDTLFPYTTLVRSKTRLVVVVYRNHQPKLVDLALRAGARVNLVAVLAEFAVLAALHVKTGVEVERAATAVELRAQSLSLPGAQIDNVPLDPLPPHDVSHPHA